MSFTPEFDNTITIHNPYYLGGQQPVNPQLCATKGAANSLKNLLADLHPVVILGPVFPNAAGSMFWTGIVPWLQFPSGLQINAGYLEMFWVRQPDNSAGALVNCKADIAQQEADLLFQQTLNS